MLNVRESSHDEGRRKWGQNEDFERRGLTVGFRPTLEGVRAYVRYTVKGGQLCGHQLWFNITMACPKRFPPTLNGLIPA
jgi:hypothetical protein